MVKMDIEKIFEEIKIKHNFNFDLKQEQKKIIDLVLNGQSVSGVLPTGYGKSMCYILPPLLLNQVILNYLFVTSLLSKSI